MTSEFRKLVIRKINNIPAKGFTFYRVTKRTLLSHGNHEWIFFKDNKTREIYFADREDNIKIFFSSLHPIKKSTGIKNAKSAKYLVKKLVELYSANPQNLVTCRSDGSKKVFCNIKINKKKNSFSATMTLDLERVN